MATRRWERRTEGEEEYSKLNHKNDGGKDDGQEFRLKPKKVVGKEGKMKVKK